MSKQQTWRFGIFFAIVGSLIFLSSEGTSATENHLKSQVLAQQAAPPPASSRPSIQDAWVRVYQQLPNLPREAQYINRVTGKADPNNTLVSRMIRYHQYVKGRPLVYRLDWKLTLGDYLGINEPILESSYPGFDNLRKNPLESDRAVISRLNRSQRNALVQSLVNVFDPAASQPIPTSVSRPQPAPVATPPAAPSGGARLLLP